MKTISQREAARLRKRVKELEKILSDQRSNWKKEYCDGWVNIETLAVGNVVREIEVEKLRLARNLGHNLIVVVSGELILFYAEKIQ